MNRAARCVMEEIPDVCIAYGDSDEYSFLLRKNCELFERREAKLISTFASTFTSYYTFYWSQFFTGIDLTLEKGLPTFDARTVLYPSVERVRQYFSWRQVDCHINNLYNTTFWSLVCKGGMTPKEAENSLIGTLAKDKNEILFSKFNINYNNEPEIAKKGTLIIREELNLTKIPQKKVESKEELSQRQKQRQEKKRRKMTIAEYHVDIIGEKFWKDRQYIFDY